MTRSGVRAIRWEPTQMPGMEPASSQLYLEGPNDKTYNLKTGSREYIDKSIGDLVRQWNARPVSSVFCYS